MIRAESLSVAILIHRLPVVLLDFLEVLTRKEELDGLQAWHVSEIHPCDGRRHDERESMTEHGNAKKATRVLAQPSEKQCNEDARPRARQVIVPPVVRSGGPQRKW